MNALLAMPLPVRLGMLFVLGAFLGSLVNLGVCRLAWYPRQFDPWSAENNPAAGRRWSDRLPVLGWLGLRRYKELCGTGFWIRPLLVELLMGVALAGLYWWEVDQQGLLPRNPTELRPGLLTLHVQFAAHALLITLMLLGSLIDADERIIPDAVTMPGTLVALGWAAIYPGILLPVLYHQDQRLFIGFVELTSPDFRTLAPTWPVWLDGLWGLGVGLGCWWLWCAALMPRTWYTRHGLARAMRLCTARLARSVSTWRMAGMGLLGTVLLVLAWRWGPPHWRGLLTALVGMAASGGLVWLVRIIGTAVLHREAMGFGDVTLMAMIGAFLGWQACILIFFLAPFAGLALGLLVLILHRQNEIAYGPFLCLAAVFTLVNWADLWSWAFPLFAQGLFVPLLLLIGLALMGLLLGAWQRIKRAWAGR